MDLILLTFFNQTMAHPLLDWLMILVTTGGFLLLPISGGVLLISPRRRRLGGAILAALLLSGVLTLLFQSLALRPRPEDVRLIMRQSTFPAYPSGHAAGAFSVALLLALAYPRPVWRLVALTGAGLIAFSRLYLGQHYPSDILGGAILGAAAGAVCYGWLMTRQPWPRRLAWLLWLQVAVALIVTQMAYLDILPSRLLLWPFADKALHFLLIGSIAFWLNLWLEGRRVQIGGWPMPAAILIPLTIALTEEGLQFFSPLRTASLLDLSSDVAGLFFFWWVSQKIVTRSERTLEKEHRVPV